MQSFVPADLAQTPFFNANFLGSANMTDSIGEDDVEFLKSWMSVIKVMWDLSGTFCVTGNESFYNMSVY